MTVTTPTGTAEVYRSPFNISGVADPDASVPELGSHDPAFVQQLITRAQTRTRGLRKIALGTLPRSGVPGAYPWDSERVRKRRSMDTEQFSKIKQDDGFIAALDQSGGSTPKALKLYGVAEDAYEGDSEMFDLVHEMRSRIVTSPSFGGNRILGAILFEMTMDRDIAGQLSASYLWNEKRVVPFLKVDKGLDAESNSTQVMKPMPELAGLLERAKDKGVFGTKMRSVINEADQAGVTAVVDQQFEVGKQILGSDLIPIIEPEVNINSSTKAEAETMLKAAILKHLDQLSEDQSVMLKLTLPEQNGFYSDVIAHPRVLRVVALSGGYTRQESNDRLSRQLDMVASFSRALTEGLNAQQSEEEFDAMLDSSIGSIYEASCK